MIWEYNGVKYQRKPIKEFICDGCSFYGTELDGACIKGHAPCMDTNDYNNPKYYIFKEIKNEAQAS